LDRTRQLGPGAALGLIGLCAIWGLGQVAIKVGNSGISPLMQAGLRSVGATLLLFIWCRASGVRLHEPGGAWRPVVAGLLFALEFLLLYRGLEYTSAARSVVFLNTSPFFVALGAHWTIAGDRFTPAKIFGLTAAFAGVLVAFSDGLRASTHTSVIGDAMCLGAAIAWGATTVLVKATALARLRPERTLMYQLAVSACILPIASVLAGEAGVSSPSPPVLAAFGYQVIAIAFFSYVVWFWFIAHYPASQVASFVFLTPIFGVAAGALLLGEEVNAALAIALVLIAAGIYVINRPVRADEALSKL
jgi:drug/metabolite transporter (DMT)-like permease